MDRCSFHMAEWFEEESNKPKMGTSDIFNYFMNDLATTWHNALIEVMNNEKAYIYKKIVLWRKEFRDFHTI